MHFYFCMFVFLFFLWQVVSKSLHIEMCLLEPLSRSVVLSKFYQFYVTYHLQHQCSIKSWRVQFELNGPGKYSSVSHSIKTHLLNTVCVLLAPVKTALTHQDTDTCADKNQYTGSETFGYHEVHCLAVAVAATVFRCVVHPREYQDSCHYFLNAVAHRCML